MCRLRELDTALKSAQAQYLEHEAPESTVNVTAIDEKHSALENLMDLASYTLASTRQQTPLPSELQQGKFAGVLGLAEKLKAATDAYSAVVDSYADRPSRTASLSTRHLRTKRKDQAPPRCRFQASRESFPDIVMHSDPGGLVEKVAGALRMLSTLTVYIQ